MITLLRKAKGRRSDCQTQYLIYVYMDFTSRLSTGCGCLVVVLSLSKRKIVSSSPARVGRGKPKTSKIGSDTHVAP
jgi:hypothetical protein